LNRKHSFILILILLFLTGCTSNENTKLKDEIKSLKEENKQIQNTNKQLEDVIKEKQNTILELEQKQSSLKDLLDQYVSASFKNQFNILDEGFFINPELTFRDELSFGKVKRIMGEPKKVNEYIEEAHCGCQETELTYEDASFTFQGELLKWFTIENADLVTQRGISVGSSKKQVIEAYGENFFANKDSIQYGEKTGISFSFKDEIVNKISIWYMYE